MKNAALLLFLLLAFQLKAQYQLDWVNVPHIANAYEFFPDDALTDENGNFYLRTYENENIQQNPNTQYITSLVKFASHGALEWKVFLGNGHIPQVNYNKLMVYRNGFIYTVTLENDSVKLFKIDTAGNTTIVFNQYATNNTSNNNYNLSLTTNTVGRLYISFQCFCSTSPNYIYEIDENDQFLKSVSAPNTLSWCNSDFTQADVVGNIYATYLNPVPGTNLSDVHLIKFSSNGSIAWDTLFSAASNTCSLLQVDSAGNFYAFDSIDLKKFDTNHNLLWTYNTNGKYPLYVKTFNEGTVYLLLQSQFSSSYRLVCLDNTGNEVYNVSTPQLTFYGAFNFHVIPDKQEVLLSEISAVNNPQGGAQVSRSEVVRIVKYDSAGNQTFFYKDTLYLPVFNDGLTYCRTSVDKNENVFFAYRFTNPQAAFVATLDPILQQIKLRAWFTAKYCKGCRHSMQGNVALDTVANCINDTLEPPIPGTMLKLNPTGSYAFTNNKGDYRFSESAFGNYSIQVLPPDYLQASCDSQLSFTLSSASPIADNNFVLTPSPVCKGVLYIGASRARPGFEQQISLYYANIGSPVWQGDVALTLANGIHYISAIPPADSVAGNTYFWHYSNLALFETGDIKVTAAVQLPLNAIYTHTAFLTNGCSQGISSLSDTLTDIVTGSYDPNDKIVYPLMVREHNAFTSPFQELTYQINFQNTGTDTAFRIVVRDTISTLLDIETFTMLTASHSYEVNMLGNRGVEWTFKNILLPDSGTNEPLSHGFIKYRINPRQGIQLGDVVLNQAAIYFDFNDPIFTNELATEYKRWLSVEEAEEETSYRVYPNPNNGNFILSASVPEEATLTITNMEGKLITQHLRPALQKETELNISDLPSGIYFLHISNGKMVATKKVVKF